MKSTIDKNTKILVLGIYPSRESEKANKYYSNKGNRFWELLEIDKNFDYEKKKRILKKYGIGLWDMFESVKRKGSADNNIISGKLNDFNNIRKKCKNLKLIIFNGKGIIKKCKKIVGKEKVKEILEVLGDDMKELYSSSSANNGQTEERKKEWKKFFKNKFCLNS